MGESKGFPFILGVTSCMRNKLLILMFTTSILILTSCNLFVNELGKLSEALKGREVIVQTYDEESNIIDKIQGESVSIQSDKKFAITDSEGKTVEKSSVINLTVGGKEVLHVGSSLVLHEQELENVFEQYARKVDIENLDRSVPFVNRMINEMRNITTGKSKIVLIRSQSGKPLATFAGDNVSYFSTDIDKSTSLLIDGQYLFIYRCDYTIYDAELLN